MGLAGLSFAAGLGAGYVDQSRYRDQQDQLAQEQARRDKLTDLAAQEAQFRIDQNARQAKMQRELDETNAPAQINTDAASLDTGSGAKVYDMPGGQDVASSDARQFRRDQAQTTGVEPAAATVKPGVGVGGKLFDDVSGGLRAAATYNDPLEKLKRRVAVISNYDPAQALELQGAIKAEEDRRADAHVEALAAHVMRQPDMKSAFGAAMTPINNVFEPSGYRLVGGTQMTDGSISATLEKKNEAGEWEFAGKNFNFKAPGDIATALRANLSPTYALKQRDAQAAAAAEQERALSKPFDLKPGEARYMFDKASGKPVQVASNDRMTSAEGRMATTGLGGSGASTRGSGSRHSDQSAIDVAAEKLKNSSWSEQQYLTAKSYLPQILDLNKGPGGATINADVAAWAAGEALDPKRVVPKFNDQTWAVGRAVVHPSGRSVFVSDTGSTPEESAAAMKDGVPAAFRSIQQKDPKSATLMLRAAAGDVKAGNELHASAEAELRARAIRENPGAKPEDIDRVVGPAVERVDAINTYRIAAINKHAPDLMKPYLAQGVPSNARPGATPDRAGTSALPADINDRVQKRAAGLAAAKAVAEQKRAQDDAALEKARMEIGGMTVEQAAQLTGKEATKIRNDPFLWRVLPANVQRVVTTRAY